MDADGLACFQPVDVFGPVAVVGIDRHVHLALFGIHIRDVRCKLIGAGLYLFQTALSDGQDDALRRFGLGDDLTAGGQGWPQPSKRPYCWWRWPRWQSCIRSEHSAPERLQGASVSYCSSYRYLLPSL